MAGYIVKVALFVDESDSLNDARNRTNAVGNAHRVRLGVDLGIADGMFIARVWACRYSK